jgi:hypothetical protein
MEGWRADRNSPLWAQRSAVFGPPDKMLTSARAFRTSLPVPSSFRGTFSATYSFISAAAVLLLLQGAISALEAAACIW